MEGERSRIIEVGRADSRRRLPHRRAPAAISVIGGLVILTTVVALGYDYMNRTPACPATEDAFALVQRDAIRQLQSPAIDQPEQGRVHIGVRQDEAGDCSYMFSHHVVDSYPDGPLEISYDGSAKWTAETRTWQSAYAAMLYGD